MPKINQLSPHVADLIAAGEVVERPASVVKELLENAIDAGARHITVEIQNGGMTFIRLTDDGCGMEREDAQKAFLRHATSKLREKEDLEAIGTLGFRGEALAAISAVSRVDLLTKPASATIGTAVKLQAGTIVSCEEAGCPDGTTIIVRDLFFNTPARMKFMKRDSVEGSAVVAVVQKQAVAHPDLAIRLIRDGKPELSTSGDGQLLSAIYSVFGRQTAMDMIEVNSKWENTTVRGYISRPTASRGNRNYQIFFVNGRHVKSRTLTAALEEAYKNQLMAGRFPACMLEIGVPLHTVDVNVHPAKTEVKFLSERDVFDCVRYGALSSLNRDGGRVEARLGKSQKAAPKEDFFRTMDAQQYRAMVDVPNQVSPASPAAVEAVAYADHNEVVRSDIRLPQRDRSRNGVQYVTQTLPEADRFGALRPLDNPAPDAAASAQITPKATPGMPCKTPSKTPPAAPDAGGSSGRHISDNSHYGNSEGDGADRFKGDPERNGVNDAAAIPFSTATGTASMPSDHTTAAQPVPKRAAVNGTAPAQASSQNTHEAPPKMTAAPNPDGSNAKSAAGNEYYGSLIPPEAEQTALELPEGQDWRVVGEVLDTYFIVEQGDEVLFIDKHAAHERVLFEKLKSEDHPIMAQGLLTPMLCDLTREEAACVLEQRALLARCGFDVDDFGDGTVVLREIPADLDPNDACAHLAELAGHLLEGRRTDPTALRDELLHSIACKAAIKAGYHTKPAERDALVRTVLTRDDIKYCPHGRPVCIHLTRRQLERQFKRA